MTRSGHLKNLLHDVTCEGGHAKKKKPAGDAGGVVKTGYISVC